MSVGGQPGSDSLRDRRDHRLDLGGPVHYVDFGGRTEGPTFVLSTASAARTSTGS